MVNFMDFTTIKKKKKKGGKGLCPSAVPHSSRSGSQRKGLDKLRIPMHRWEHPDELSQLIPSRTTHLTIFFVILNTKTMYNMVKVKETS